MADILEFTYEISDDDFTRAVEASFDVKKKLKKLGVSPDVIRRVSIALYEGEINMVIHANGGKITIQISEDSITMILDDKGPGIPDIDKAMQAGFSTAPDNVRNLGFGAGMGLPNMKKNTDSINIETKIGVGTKVTMVINL
ncbi:MAG: ATP-binding protein [Lachnospiraceae bacterium]|nr:ATP-binding protein [Lachnospiraceae bacterium]